MAPKSSSKSSKPKTDKKAAKQAAPEAESKTTEAKAAEAKAAEPAIDPDEIEEQEDAAAAASSGGGGNEAALAAAGTSGEISASFKNFRHHPDMENFYRFIYENDLRHEALAIIDDIMVEKKNRKAAKGKH